jgi:hypothetical protein
MNHLDLDAWRQAVSRSEHNLPETGDFHTEGELKPFSRIRSVFSLFEECAA